MTLSLFSLEGRTALVTGSSKGIGFALARGLGRAGARIVLNGRDPATLSGAAGVLRGEGIDCGECVFDVTDSPSVDEGIDRIERGTGPIDILVNNAGMQRRAPLEDFPESDWRALMSTNVDSVFYVSKAVAKHMIPRGRGKIINICSVQSELGRPMVAPYATTKGALKMLTKGMCIDWAPHGIQVNGIGPGYFRTELTDALVKDATFNDWLVNRTPARRWGDVEELAGATVYLASDASSFMTGQGRAPLIPP